GDRGDFRPMSDPRAPSPGPDATAFFRERFGVDERALTRVLGSALERQVDAADLFFEYTAQDSVALEEGIVKSGDRHVEQGVGVRVVAGEKQGYAHSDDITVESLELAAATARAISEAGGAGAPVAVRASAPARDLYPVAIAPTDVPVADKVRLLEEIDRYARGRDPRIVQVMASLIAQQRHVMVATSDGASVGDLRPLVRLNVQVIAQGADGRRREVGYQGMGGRYELARLLDPAAWRPLVDEAVRVALLNLDAVPCPAGSLDVVLGPGWP